MGWTWKGAALAAATIALAACGSGSPRPGDHLVTITWQQNHERGVNGPGGGYRLTIAGRPEVALPYDAGLGFAPSSLTTVLYTGTYAVSVVAYQPATTAGLATTSAPARLLVVVP